MKRFTANTPGDFSARVDKQSGDELGQLASYFNLFMEKLEQYNEKLQGEIVERKQAEEGLRLSEEMFSKAFRSSPNGVCIISLDDGRFINANDTFLVSTGYRREEIIDRNVIEAAIFGDEHKASSLIDSMTRGERVRDQEIEIFARSGKRRVGMLSAEAIEIRNERCMLLTIEDITDRMHLEREIKDNVLIHDNIVSTHLFHIAQEAVQNAVKHAAADHITVDLCAQDGLITLRVTDDGVGFLEATNKRGMGLRIMGHRAKMIGALIDIKPNPADGTIVECRVRDPIRQEAVHGSAQG